MFLLGPDHWDDERKATPKELRQRLASAIWNGGSGTRATLPRFQAYAVSPCSSTSRLASSCCVDAWMGRIAFITRRITKVTVKA